MTSLEDDLRGEISKLHEDLRQLKPRSGDKLWEVLMKLTVPGLMAVIGWGITLSINVSNLQLISMTKADGFALEKRVMDSLPPEWLRDDLSEIKLMLRDFDVRIRDIEKQVK